MKKVTTILCAAVAIACMSGCSDSNKDSQTAAKTDAPKSTVELRPMVQKL